MLNQQQTQQIEQPLYTLNQNKARAIIPKIITYIFLGIIFYAGILLNLSLLNLSSGEETIVKIISSIILLSVIVLGIYLTWHKSHQSYFFYKNKVIFGKKVIDYRDIQLVSSKKDIVDKMFHSYSIPLRKDFFIRHIPPGIDLVDYLNKLVSYAKQNNL